MSRLALLRAAILLLPLAATGCSSAMQPAGQPTLTAQPAAPAAGTGDAEEDLIGASEHPKILASFGGVYSDRPAEIMLAQIVSKLLAAADQPNSNFTVSILDSAEVNAFALPGGYIYVTRGILALANDQSELAAVLAHEIAHVVLKHARARSNRVRTTAIVDKVVSGVLGANASTDQGANKAKMSLAAFSQAQELAADKEGIMIAGKAGFDPHAAARFLAAMGRFAQYSSGKAAHADDFLSSHPSTPDRIQKATETARSFFGPPGIGEQGRAEYMSAINGLLFGDSPAQGVISGQQFIHPGLKFTFTVPSGYTLQMSKGAVVGVAGDGEAVRFDSAQVPTSTPLADYLKSGWIAGLKPETVTSGRVNGADVASGTAATEQWNFRVEVIRYDGTVYRFIFATRAESAAFDHGAASTLASFRTATPADLRLVHSVQVETVTAGPSDTAPTLARRMSGVAGGANLFYILNNLFPGDPVKAGAAYKVVAIH